MVYQTVTFIPLSLLFRANSRSPLQKNCIIVWNCHLVAFRIGDWRATDVCPRLFRELITPDPVPRMWGPSFRTILFRANSRSPLQKELHNHLKLSSRNISNRGLTSSWRLSPSIRKSLTTSSRCWRLTVSDYKLSSSRERSERLDMLFLDSLAILTAKRALLPLTLFTACESHFFSLSESRVV